MPATVMPDAKALYSSAFRRCLEEVDVAGMRKLHAHVFPHLPPAGSDKAVLAQIHYARTQAESMPLKARAWSHRWLLDNDYPSGMPDHLKPKAERLYPRIAEATGFSMGFRSPLVREVMAPVIPTVLAAIEDVILDEYSGKVVNHDRLRSRILETKDRIIRREVGRPV